MPEGTLNGVPAGALNGVPDGAFPIEDLLTKRSGMGIGDAATVGVPESIILDLFSVEPLIDGIAGRGGGDLREDDACVGVEADGFNCGGDAIDWTPNGCLPAATLWRDDPE